MAEETHQEQPPAQQHTQNSDHRGAYHHHPRDHRYHNPRPAAEPQNPAQAEKRPDADDIDDDAKDDQQMSSRQHHQHGGGHRGGRPPKKVYEEFINDPYCE